MKKFLLLPLLFLFLITGCGPDDADTQNNNGPATAENLLNISYGANAEQLMDVYLPANRTADTKVVLLLHGGSWIAGNKSDLSSLVPLIQAQFPNHAIVNINYRLATTQSPALPKQIEDIQMAISYLENSNYIISDDYAFIGFSAGAHLAMLYSYKYDTAHDVKAVCDVVGPVDFADPAYADFPELEFTALTLTGSASPTPQMIADVSPVTHVTAQSPPTIMFYGGQDPLIPSSQGPILRDKLIAAGVSQDYNFYPNGGHGDWDAATFQQVYAKIAIFLQQHL